MLIAATKRRVPVIGGEEGLVCHCLRKCSTTSNLQSALLAGEVFDQRNLQAVPALLDRIVSSGQAVAHLCRFSAWLALRPNRCTFPKPGAGIRRING